MSVAWSDWIAVGSVLFLGAVALLAPYVSEMLKRRFMSAKLLVEFENKPPFCHRTKRVIKDSSGRVLDTAPVYYFRFCAYNHGKSRAHSCEAILEEVWKSDSLGGLPPR